LKYVLDTNAVSALMKGEPAAVEQLLAVHRDDVAIPQPVIAEIAYGIERFPRSKRRQRLQERFDLICSELARATWTDTVSERFGNIKATLERKDQRIEDFDAGAKRASGIPPRRDWLNANRSHRHPLHSRLHS
jgi:predicted nucleic acid-binding protein